jgi:methionyl-tRNA synthetase
MRWSITCPPWNTNPGLERFWPANTHLVGKDILTTHAVYWSTMLMALERPLPHSIFAHGWWTVDGEKMSKSRGNVVDPNAMIDQFGADAFRYFLLREVPFGQDGDFSRNTMVTTINSALANGIGNLLSRTLTMIERSCAGTIPDRGPAVLPELEARIEDLARQLPGRIEAGYNALLFRDVLLMIEELNTACDEYIDKSAPWKLAKQADTQPQLQTVLNTSARALRLLAILLYPFMPQAAQQMIRQLGLPLDLSKPISDTHSSWDTPLAGSKTEKGASLFPRIETKPQGAKPVSETPASPQPSPCHSEPRCSPKPGPCDRRPRCRATGADRHRRLHENPTEGGEGPGRGASSEIRKAAQAPGQPRQRTATDRRRHRQESTSRKH